MAGSVYNTLHAEYWSPEDIIDNVKEKHTQRDTQLFTLNKNLCALLTLQPRIFMFVRYFSHSQQVRTRQDLLFVQGFEAIKYVNR